MSAQDNVIEPCVAVQLREKERRARRADYYRGWLSRNPDYHKERRAEYLARYLWRDARLRAKAKGVDFLITVEDVERKMEEADGVCRLLGVRFEIGHPDNAASLDRIDPTRGYTPDNIWIICMKANRGKNNLTVAEFLFMAKNMERMLQPQSLN